MSASERKVVHDHLLERSGIETFSEGEEPERCVIVAPLVSRVSDPESALLGRVPVGGRAGAAGADRADRRPTNTRPTTVRDPQEAWRTHVLDSLTGLEVPELRDAERIADVGAGAGFPGLALAAALPDAHVDLIEATSRKCEFMRAAARADPDRQRAGRLRPRRGVGRGPPARRRPRRRRMSSPPARSVGFRRWPSSPRRCFARAACWWPGRGAATPTRRPRPTAPPSAWPWSRAERSPDGPRPPGSSTATSTSSQRADRRPPGLPRRAGMAKKRPFGQPAEPGRLSSPRADGTGLRDRESEGRGGEDHHGRQHRRLRGDAAATRCCSSTSTSSATRRSRSAATASARPSSYDCLTGDTSVAEAARPAGPDNLWLVPASRDLAGASVELPRIEGSELHLRDSLGPSATGSG